MTQVLKVGHAAPCDARTLAIAAALLVLLGVGIGHRLFAPASIGAEPPAAQERYSPRAVAAARDPAASVQPAKRTPAGTRAVRVAQAVLLPDDPRCRPVTVTATLAKEKSGAQRVVFEADGANIESAIDRPLEAAIAAAAPKKWAVGPMYQPLADRYGIMAQRDLWRARLTAQVIQDRDMKLEPWVGVLFTF